jgi:hypothetical protein
MAAAGIVDRPRFWQKIEGCTDILEAAHPNIRGNANTALIPKLTGGRSESPAPPAVPGPGPSESDGLR